MQAQVKDIMQPSLICIEGDVTTRQALEVANANAIHHLPIRRAGRIVGIVCTKANYACVNCLERAQQPELFDTGGGD